MRVASAHPNPNAVQIPPCEVGRWSKGSLAGLLALNVAQTRYLPKGARRIKDSSATATGPPACFRSNLLASTGVRAPPEPLATELAWSSRLLALPRMDGQSRSGS